MQEWQTQLPESHANGDLASSNPKCAKEPSPNSNRAPADFRAAPQNTYCPSNGRKDRRQYQVIYGEQSALRISNTYKDIMRKTSTAVSEGIYPDKYGAASLTNHQQRSRHFNIAQQDFLRQKSSSITARL